MVGKKTALVTGGAGFIGRHIVRDLLARGTEVRVLDLHAGRLPPHKNLSRIAGSILERDILWSAMDGVSDVFHLAGTAELWLPNEEEFHRLNVIGTEEVLVAAKALNIETVVVTSTDVILKGWRNKSAEPINETTPLPARDAVPGAYCRSKWDALKVAEDAAQDGQNVIIVHPTVPVGANDPSMTPPTRMIADFLQGKNPAYLDCILDLVSVEDVAQAHVRAAEIGKPGKRYIIGGETIKLSELLSHIEEISGRKMPTLQIPFFVTHTVGVISSFLAGLTGKKPRAPLSGVRLARTPMIVDCSQTRTLLDVSRTPVKDAVSGLIAWLNASQSVQPASFEWKQTESESAVSEWVEPLEWPVQAAKSS